MLIKIPYKTCRLWRLFDHFRKMALKSIKKALGFSLKVEGVFTPLRNVKKALVLEHSGAPGKVDQNTL